MKRSMRACPVLAGLVLVGQTNGQWVSDPAVNLAIADHSGEQTQVKVHATADGGAYLSWFDNTSGGYDVYLQRIDASGVEQWAHNGVLLADRGFSSTQNYSLDVDAAGNALLAFRDDRPAGTQITATKVSPAGGQLWGPTGVQLTATAAFVAAPKIAATTDGNVVVAWTQDSDTIVQKLDGNGVPLWGAGVVLTDPGASSLAASDMHASDAGGVIISLVRGFLGATLYAQKLSTTGTQVWAPSPIAIFDGGSLQTANFPTFVSDGSGGAVFGWYGTGPLQCYVQHVLANGTEKFAHDGVVASTNLTQIRVSPAVSYDIAADEIFLFWTELNGAQSQWGIYGQKFDGAGARQWSDQAKLLVALDSTERTQVRNLQLGDGAMVFWVETIVFGNQRVVATRVDGSGSMAWGDPMPLVSNVASSKSRLAAALSSDDVALLAWIDGRNDSGDVYAQNVNADGTLGPGAGPGDVDDDGDVDTADLLALLAAWGPCPPACPPSCAADFNEDCQVGTADLLELLANWG